MAKAIKLSEAQERIIVAAAAGGASLRELAAEYGVSKDTISKILRANKDLQTDADSIKKEYDEKAYADLSQFFEQNRGKLAGRVAKALNVPDEILDKASVRDRAGFAKVVTELIIEMRREGQGESEGGGAITVEVVNNAKRDEG